MATAAARGVDVRLKRWPMPIAPVPITPQRSLSAIRVCSVLQRYTEFWRWFATGFVSHCSREAYVTKKCSRAMQIPAIQRAQRRFSMNNNTIQYLQSDAAERGIEIGVLVNSLILEIGRAHV